MVNKKKFVNTYCIVLLGVLFAMFFGLFSNSYAMTTEELEYYLQYTHENFPQDNAMFNNVNNYFTNNSYNSIASTISERISIADYDLVSFQFDNSNGFMMFVRFNNYENNKIVLYGTRFSVFNGLDSFSLGKWTYYTFSSNSWVNSFNVSAGEILSVNNNSISFIYPAVDFYRNYSDLNPTPINELTSMSVFSSDYNSSSITLTAVKSGQKFTFHDKDQLQVMLTGDYNITDFVFYVQRYIEGQWENFSDRNDFYRLTGYQNPYYILWNNLNYYPVGTYRYMAEYQGENSFSVVSNEFQITSSVVDNSVTGSVDNNGNININIDNGNSVDNIKDFMGGEADFSNLDINEQSIKETLNIQQTANPYSNFVLDFLTGLTGALTTVTPESLKFKVHSWGSLITVSVADITPSYSYEMASFMSTISTLVVVIAIVKWVTQIIENINTANVDKTLELIEEKYSDLF